MKLNCIKKRCYMVTTSECYYVLKCQKFQHTTKQVMHACSYEIQI